MTREEMIDEAVRRGFAELYKADAASVVRYTAKTCWITPHEMVATAVAWKALHAQPREPNGRFRKKK